MVTGTSYWPFPPLPEGPWLTGTPSAIDPLTGFTAYLLDQVIEAGGRRQGAPWGYLRQAILSVDGGPSYDVTHLSARPADVAARYLDPIGPWLRPMKGSDDHQGNIRSALTGAEFGRWLGSHDRHRTGFARPLGWPPKPVTPRWYPRAVS